MKIITNWRTKICDRRRYIIHFSQKTYTFTQFEQELLKQDYHKEDFLLLPRRTEAKIHIKCLRWLLNVKLLMNGWKLFLSFDLAFNKKKWLHMCTYVDICVRGTYVWSKHILCMGTYFLRNKLNLMLLTFTCSMKCMSSTKFGQSGLWYW